MKNSVDFCYFTRPFAATNFRVPTHLSKRWRGTWSEKGWEPCDNTTVSFMGSGHSLCVSQLQSYLWL